MLQKHCIIVMFIMVTRLLQSYRHSQVISDFSPALQVFYITFNHTTEFLTNDLRYPAIYLIHKLQIVQLSAASVLCRIPRHEHISPVSKELHWLPISFRIKLKICMITFRVLRGHGPSYLSSMLKIKHSQYSLRSSDFLLLDVPKTNCKTLGDRALKFFAAAPREWNALPKDLPTIYMFCYG